MFQPVRELHDKAMELSQLGMVTAHTGEAERARQLYSEALPFERQAAEQIAALPDQSRAEPTRGILFYSAASIAFKAGNYEEAERIVAVQAASRGEAKDCRVGGQGL